MRSNTLVRRIFRWNRVLHNFSAMLNSTVLVEESVERRDWDLQRFDKQLNEIEAQLLHLGKIAKKCFFETRN